MEQREGARQRAFIVLGVFGAIILLTNLALITGTDFGIRIEKLHVPEVLGGHSDYGESVQNDLYKLTPLDDLDFDKSFEQVDRHPIVGLMREAAEKFRAYESSRSTSFAEAVKVYRERYGRHPPPGFDKWYKFARDRGIYHLDDFDQINDDLRPFWSIPPADLRLLVHGMLAEDAGPSGLAGLAIKDGKVKILTSKDNWRAETMRDMVAVFAKELPDMEFAMNRLDQPRVIVEWEVLQEHLKREEETRRMPENPRNEFTPRNMVFKETLPVADWFKAPGKPYMDLVKPACPPDSYARSETMSPEEAEAKYKLPHTGGIVSSFNTSSDLCTVGPAVSQFHGFMFSASSVTATKKLVPVFGECKVNVNNDILFPANMYYRKDERYQYSDKKDVAWEDKATTMFWRGITSGGVQVKDSWRRLHRHRLVLMTNATQLEETQETYDILRWASDTEKNYTEVRGVFHPAEFAEKHTDVGFPDMKWCVPDDNCGWLKQYLSPVSQTTMTDQFTYKYLVDVDGHSFSGRWHAFLKSRSMGIKATIFREWHDSRLFAWLHFAPMDNRFDDLYTLLTYFIGLGTPADRNSTSALYVPGHDFEGKKLANQARDWAAKVLRKQDIEIYMYRLMLEYGRLLDDDRDAIGYGGDGSEIDEGRWNS